MYGGLHRAVGGKTDVPCDYAAEDDQEGDSDDDDVEVPSFKDLGEPAFWWSMELKFYHEKISSHHIHHVIDTTPGPGKFAMACLLHEPPIGYLGICFPGETHKARLMEHLINEYLLLMGTEGSPNLHPSICEAR